MSSVFSLHKVMSSVFSLHKVMSSVFSLHKALADNDPVLKSCHLLCKQKCKVMTVQSFVFSLHKALEHNAHSIYLWTKRVDGNRNTISYFNVVDRIMRKCFFNKMPKSFSYSNILSLRNGLENGPYKDSVRPICYFATRF